MKRTFVLYLGLALLFWEKLKGTKTVREVKHPRNTLGYLEGYSVAGYKLEIYCQRKHYRRSYDKWFVPNKDHMAYRVFSVVSQDAPESLKKACELDIDIPALLPLAVGDHSHRQAAVNAYLDILIERLGHEVFCNADLTR